MSGLLIVGAGGHGKVVAETAKEMGKWNKIAFLDDFYNGQEILDLSVVGRFNDAIKFKDQYKELIVAIGNNLTRINLMMKYKQQGFTIPNIIHPTAYVCKNTYVEDGCVFFAQSAVNTQSKIGFGSIINTGATVDHDCQLGKGVHLSPGVHLGGTVKIGNYTWIGLGAGIINNISIGNNVIVGAGSIVISDIKDNVTVVGVPGKVIKKHKLEEN
jgi:sugar O-acyltransferase (sialic acid O-acetyltransferase NeuD family)